MCWNVSGTVVQGEVSYRPDFPLATGSGDQINQIADASGTSLALTAFGHDTYALAPANITAGATLPAVVNNLATASAISKDFGTLLKSVQRSSLPVIDPSLVKVYDATSYYRSTAFINYDVWSADIGTTTTFTASHPLTKGLGADSTFLLTELAMVQIQDMDDLTKGFVARGGFNEGSGEHLCLGIFRNLSGAEIAAVNANSGLDAIDYDLSTIGGVTNVGASIVDAVFGNGSYCEGQMGADERSFSYRLVGGATYQNAMNSAWTLSPSFVWSHDPSGNGYCGDQEYPFINKSLSHQIESLFTGVFLVKLIEGVPAIDTKLLPLTTKAPASTNVSPPYVLLPERNRFPSPCLRKFDEEEDPEIIPLKVALRADWPTVSSLPLRSTEPAP